MLQEHERRTGTRIDRNDPQAIILALRLQQQEFDRERGILRDERTAVERRRQELEGEVRQIVDSAEADGVIDPEEAQGIRQRLSKQPTKVSGIATVMKDVSSEVKEIAAGIHSNDWETNGDDSIGFANVFGGSSSFAASLEGEHSYNKGIKNEDLIPSLQETFAASANPPELQHQALAPEDRQHPHSGFKLGTV